MAELCTALIRAATEFPRDRKAKIITDVSARLSVPDEGADVRNEWIASTGASRRRRRRRRRVGLSKTRNCRRPDDELFAKISVCTVASPYRVYLTH